MRSLLPLAAVALTGVYATPFAGFEHPAPKLSKRAVNVNGTFIATTAPRDNIFADFTPDEEDEILAWLESRANSSSITADLDFSLSKVWLLAPNKTDATSYLDGEGEKPDRYARVLGKGDCFAREFMVGPLPLGNSTKATPLDYALRGNATLETGLCTEDGLSSGSERRSYDEILRKRSLARRDPTNPYEEKMGWNKRELPNDEKQPPVAFLPDGARFEFDPEQNYVTWSISLHDIRYKGERLVYELAMQEALAHYSGPDQLQTETSWLDVTVGFKDFNLIAGYDCPAYATYAGPFCLFEFQKDFPLARHLSYGSYYHATKNVAFMVRSVSSVGNYDYMTTYEFHYDGTINVIVRASGYIQASTLVDDPEAWDYGFRIRDNLSGSMHDHVLNFKADLDVLGTKNSIFKTEFVPHSQVYDWSDGQTINTMKIERSFVENEDDGKINWAPNAAASYAVVNKDEPNEFGEYPGFKIFPSTGTATHLTVENSSQYTGQINWAAHNLHALRRHDTEPNSAHPEGGLNTKVPFINFDDFFDGESLDQEDLVLYFNLGMHHMPDTYDLPVTLFQGAQSGITLRPQNFGRGDNSVSTRQQMHVSLAAEGGGLDVETYGVDELTGTIDEAEANPPFLLPPAMPSGY